MTTKKSLSLVVVMANLPLPNQRFQVLQQAISLGSFLPPFVVLGLEKPHSRSVVSELWNHHT